MKKYFLIFTLLFAVIFKSNAQFGYGKLEDIQEVKENTLLVVLDELSPSLDKQLDKNPEKYQYYIDEINAYNESLKLAFKNSWTFSENIQFINNEEFKEIMNDSENKDNYAYFINSLSRSPKLGFVNPSKTTDRNVYSFALGLTNKRTPVYEQLFTTHHPTEADLTFVIQQFQNYFKHRSLSKEEKKELRNKYRKGILEYDSPIKSKTLYIDEALIAEDVKNNIEDFYAYSYKFTDKQAIDNAILARDKNILYLKAIPSFVDKENIAGSIELNKTMYRQTVVDAEDGKIIDFVLPPNSWKLNSGVSRASNIITTLKTLEKISNNVK